MIRPSLTRKLTSRLVMPSSARRRTIEFFGGLGIGPYLQLGDSLANDILTPKTGNSEEMLVDILDAAGFQIDQCDAVGVGIEELPQRALALKDGPLRFLVFTHKSIAQVAGE